MKLLATMLGVRENTTVKLMLIHLSPLQKANQALGYDSVSRFQLRRIHLQSHSPGFIVYALSLLIELLGAQIPLLITIVFF